MNNLVAVVVAGLSCNRRHSMVVQIGHKFEFEKDHRRQKLKTHCSGFDNGIGNGMAVVVVAGLPWPLVFRGFLLTLPSLKFCACRRARSWKIIKWLKGYGIQFLKLARSVVLWGKINL